MTFSKEEEKKTRRGRRRTIPSLQQQQRPHTAAGRLFTSSSTHLSEAEQDYVRRRIRQKSAGMRGERDRSVTSQSQQQQQQRAPYRCRSSLVRSEGRKFVEYVAGCKQADVEGGVPDVQAQAKRLLMSATLEYQKCLEQDVGQFIVDVQF